VSPSPSATALPPTTAAISAQATASPTTAANRNVAAGTIPNVTYQKLNQPGTIPNLIYMKLSQAEETLQAEHIAIQDIIRSGTSGRAGDVNSNWIVCQQHPPSGALGNAVTLVLGVRC
jgi:hypothetical protein